MTHWTQSGPGEQHGSVGLIAVDEIMKDAAGAEVLKTKAELGEVGEGAQAFIFEVIIPTTRGCFCGKKSSLQYPRWHQQFLVFLLGSFTANVKHAACWHAVPCDKLQSVSMQ